MRAKEYAERELIRILKNNGYEYDRSNGDHDIYINRETGNSISITAGKTMNKMVVRRLIKENNLKVD